MIDYVLLPLIGLLIALFGVFFDAKSKPKSLGTVTLVALLILTTVYSGWSGWEKNRKAEEDTKQAVADKNVLRDTLLNVSNRLGDIGHGVDFISEQLGIRKENQSSEVVTKAIQADMAFSRLAATKSTEVNQKVTVQYFPKEIDRVLVQSTLVAALSRAGFSIRPGIGNPSLSQVPTNSVWYGASVPDDSIRLVVLALARAGVGIRGIQPFGDPGTPAKANLIQVGSYNLVQDRPAYSVDQISSMAIPR